MDKSARIPFAAVMVALGILGLIYGDFALVWQRIPIAHLPGRTLIAYACAALELGAGLGLLLRSTVRLSSGILFAYLVLWVLLLKLPAVVLVPQMEATWLGFGEIAVILAGAWILFVEHAGPWERSHWKFVVGTNGVRNARLLFALSLPMIGLSHFVYGPQTAAMVPPWLPYRLGWAYLTGAGSIAAALALLLGVWPRLAATLESGMMSVITLLVWGLGVAAAPTDRVQWTGLCISSAFAIGCWAVASSYRGAPWLAVGKATKGRAQEP